MTENDVAIYGTSWCGDCRRVKEVLERRGVDYAWVDVGFWSPRAGWALRSRSRSSGRSRTGSAVGL